MRFVYLSAATLLAGTSLVVAAGAQTTPVEQVRKAYYDQTGDAEALAKRLLSEHPGDVSLARWNKKLEDSDQDETPSADDGPVAQPDAKDGWAILARARKASPWEKQILCDEALTATPNDMDLLIETTAAMRSILYAATDEEQGKAFRAEVMAFLKEHAAAFQQSAYTLAAEAQTEQELSTGHDDTAKESAKTAMESADRSLALDAMTADAILVKLHLLNSQNDRKAGYGVLQKSVADGSLSVSVFEAYLSAILGQTGLSAEERNKLLLAAITARLDKGAPSRRLVNAMISNTESAGIDTTTAIEEMIIKRYPGSDGADMAHLFQATITDPAIATDPYAVEKSTALEEYLDSPGPHDPVSIKDARAQLIFTLSNQDNPDVARLYQELLLPHDDTYMDARAMVKLAEHKAHLPEVEQMAQRLYDEQVQKFPRRLESQTDKQGFAEFAQDYFYAPWLNALGEVYFQQGKLDQAQEKLLSAAAMTPRNLGIAMRLGKVYEARGDYKQAQKTFTLALSMSTFGPGEHPAVAALRKNYELQHPDHSGLDTYMKDILQHDLDRRQTAVLGDRLAHALDVPAIKLTTLDGKTISSSDFSGKVVVINFWATWCGPCREELPDFEKLYTQYRNDPNVLVLSMSIDSADTPVATIANFIRAHQYTFPVVLGPDYGKDNSIVPIPMSWFIASGGKIMYRKIGYTKELVQEFSWRMEALRSDSAVKTSASK